MGREGGSEPEQGSGPTGEKLIKAARCAFLEQGYAKTSMDELCARVDLTRGALYHHFGGKSGLLAAVVERLHTEIGDELDAYLAEEPEPWSGFRRCCRRYLEMALRPETRRILFQEAPAVLGSDVRRLEECSIQPIQTALEAAMADGAIVRTDPEPLARLLSGAMNDAALWIAGSDDPEATLERAVAGLTHLLDGLQVPR